MEIIFWFQRHSYFQIVDCQSISPVIYQHERLIISMHFVFLPLQNITYEVNYQEPCFGRITVLRFLAWFIILSTFYYFTVCQGHLLGRKGFISATAKSSLFSIRCLHQHLVEVGDRAVQKRNHHIVSQELNREIKSKLAYRTKLLWRTTL